MTKSSKNIQHVFPVAEARSGDVQAKQIEAMKLF